MNSEELKKLLIENYVPESDFSLDGSRRYEALILLNEEALWKIVYMERGSIFPVKSCFTEEEACEFLYARFKERYGFIENTWDEIPYFKAGATFKSLEKHLEKEIANGVAEEVSILEENLPADFILGERMFRHIPSGKIWRLAKPEYPFRGFWKTL